MTILEYAEKVLQVRLSCLQKDWLVLLQKDSDYVQYVDKKSHAFITVLYIYDKWKETKQRAS